MRKIVRNSLSKLTIRLCNATTEPFTTRIANRNDPTVFKIKSILQTNIRDNFSFNNHMLTSLNNGPLEFEITQLYMQTGYVTYHSKSRIECQILKGRLS